MLDGASIYICVIRVCEGRMMVVEPQPDEINDIQGSMSHISFSDCHLA